MTKDMYDRIYKICAEVRKQILDKYGDTQLHCVEASEILSEKLTQSGFENKIVEGWCSYDDYSNCSDRSYDEHTWVELADGTYVDVTADQFEYFIDDEIPEIIIDVKPYYMSYEEPENLFDQEF